MATTNSFAANMYDEKAPTYCTVHVHKPIFFLDCYVFTQHA